TGYSKRSFELLHELGALDVLLPPVASWLERAGPEEGQALFRSLGLLDDVVRGGHCPDDAVLLSTLLIHHSQHQLVKNAPAPEAGLANGAAPEGAQAEPAEAEEADGAEEQESAEIEELEAIERAADEEAP